jgi:DNA polymerase-1
MNDSKKTFLIIDGNALVHRAFHALPPLSTKEGKLINAAYGFTSVLIKILKDLKPSYAAVAFDTAAPTFRHKEFKEYKAQRIKQPQEFYDQFPMVKEVLKAFNIPVFEKEGYEADDIIATVCRKNEETDKSIENIILTGDLDTLQLVDDKTKVLSFKKGISETILYDEAKIKEVFGMEPKQTIDFKALRGDPSDNIPGVKGIGEVTAKELIQKFGSVEGIYRGLRGKEAGIREKLAELLEKSEEIAESAKDLVTLRKDAPIDFKLKDARIGAYDTQKISKIFEKLEFRSLLKRLSNSEGGVPSSSKDFGETGEKKTAKIEIVPVNQKILAAMTAGIHRSRVVYFKIKNEFLFLNFRNRIYKIDLSASAQGLWRDKKEKAAKNKIAAIFVDGNILKVGYDIKKEIPDLQNFRIGFEGKVFDILVAAYLLYPGKRQYLFDEIILSELGRKIIFNGSADIGHLKFYPEIHQKLSRKLKENGLVEVSEKIEMPLLKILAKMEKVGVNLDIKFLERMKKKVKNDLKKLESRIYKIAGQKINLNSPKQLKTILFDKFKLNERLRLRKTKTGISTAASELIKMKGLHPIVDLILEYRELFKLYSTYLEALPKLINSKTKRLHTQFNQTITATGRLSSSEPNLQNIPVRASLGQQIRKAFVADKNFLILAADYSQIELRIAAHLSGDKEMIEAFRCRKDFHTHTAAAVFGVPENKVTSEMRRLAKVVNFGIIYGMGPASLAESTAMPFAEAQDFISQYFTLYKGIYEYIEQTKALARSLGYVETLFGRRRYLPEITSGVPQIRAMAERMAINHPVQGTAADLIKMAMIEIDREIENHGWENLVKMILQVHDELVFEVKKEFAKTAAKMIKERMETVYKLRVPLEVNVKRGKNWGELRKIKF